MAMAPEPKPGEKVEGPDQLQKLSKMLTGVWMKPSKTEEPAPGK
jgi:hypothetical protein